MQSLTQYGAQASCLRCASILLALLFLSVGATEAHDIPSCGKLLPNVGSAGCIEVDYDRFSGRASATLKFQVVNQTSTVVSVTFMSFKFDQGPIRFATSMGIVVIRAGMQRTEQRSMLYVLADSKRMPISFDLLKADFPDDLMTRELFTAAVAVDDLRKLGDTKTLEMKFREHEFEFNEAMRKSLREFATDYCSLPTAH